jgi:3-oxoadipyl-CoA thiolase
MANRPASARLNIKGDSSWPKLSFATQSARRSAGYAGALAKVRTDDLAAVPLKSPDGAQSQGRLEQARRGLFRLRQTRPARTTATSPAWRCCSAGLPDKVPGVTLNRLCASGLNAVGAAAQAIRAGDIDFAIAGGVESMTRAPFVQGKATEAFARAAEIYDTTIGWRFINP